MYAVQHNTLLDSFRIQIV